MIDRTAGALAGRPRTFVLVLVLTLLALPSFAAVNGTVTNGTTGKAAAGADVVLLELSQGMKEAAQTKTDASGHYKIDADTGGGMPHLVRVSYQNVNYFKMVPPGTSSADVQVYDAAKKLDGLAYNIETAFQTNAGKLEIAQFYVVRNGSTPPRTQSGGEGFQIAIPENASIQQADVQSPGGQPIQTAPDPKGKGRYAFDYPLRPGETTFRIVYTLPYSGEATFKPTMLYPVDQYAIITPPGMTFSAKASGAFSAQPHQGGVSIQIANNVSPSADLSYRISGSGQMPDENAQGGDQGGMGGDQNAGDQQAMGGARPGGGLGTPINSPDPLTRYKWPILLGLAAVLVAGAFHFITQRPATATTVKEQAVEPALAEAPRPASRSSLLLEAMKEELFQLELDRQQGRISPDEYAKAKAALDATLQRALARQNGTTVSAQSV